MDKIIIAVENLSLKAELLDTPTARKIVEALPLEGSVNVWGDEIYTSSSPISIPEENSQSVVSLNDVAYWPTGKAICLFYGPTPIGNPGEITPASPVNIIGKIISPDKKILDDIHSERATFSLQS